MRRFVFIALAIEVVVAAVVVFGAITDRSDAAGRGLANAYALAIAAPVVLGILLWVAGWTRVAGIVALALPLMAAYSRWSDAASKRRVEETIAGDGWFRAPTVLALTKAIAARDTASMRAARSADASIVDAVAIDGSATVLTHTILNAPGMTHALLELGADPSLAAPNGMFPLVAAIATDPVIVNELLARGADADAPFMGEPVIFNAFRTGRRAEAMTLATRGADATRLSRRGETTALAAARHHLFDVAAALIERGADPQRPDDEGKTLRDFVQDEAMRAYHDEPRFQRLVQMLRARGVEVTLPAAERAGAS